MSQKKLRKPFQITLLFLLLHLHPTQAQQPDSLPWCPTGATWLYEHTNAWGQFYYLKLSYTHDTIIDNTSCKALKINNITIYGWGPIPFSYNWTQDTSAGYEYFANINDSIHRWQGGQFVFLYDFNAAIGQKWLMPANPDYACLDTLVPSVDTFTVSNANIQVFDNHHFETIEGTNHGNWAFGTTVVKNIGSLRAPFVVPIHNDCFYIDGDGTPKRLCCYKDDLRGSISFDLPEVGNCHFAMTPVEKIAATSSISISPNPVVKELFIQHYQNNITTYTLYDLHGRMLVQQDYTNDFISLGNYQAGVYFLVLKTEKGELFSFKVIKMN